MAGMDYVGDDIVCVERVGGNTDGVVGNVDAGGNLRAHQIYSTSSLSSFSVEKLPGFKGVAMGDNWNKTKTIYSLAPYFENFRKSVAVNVVMFPNIVGGDVPSIEKTDKGKAITQLVHSTMEMMCAKESDYIQTDPDTTVNIRGRVMNSAEEFVRLMSLVKDLDFYQINLSSDFDANVDALKEFLKGL
jgi:hypothetical protein